MTELEYLTAHDRQIPFIEESPDTAPNGSVLMTHGIFVEKNEEGRFTRLSEDLVEQGLRTVRFDYAGHGDHEIDSEDMTICSTLLDMFRMMEYVEDSGDSSETYVVASSFGASLFLLYLQLRRSIVPDRLTLWNPVTDYDTTFLEPQAENMRDVFSNENLDQIYENGTQNFHPTMEFPLSLQFIFELDLYDPHKILPDLDTPTKVIHGDSDKEVSYEITKNQTTQSPAVDFHTINDAGHAFFDSEAEAEARRVTVDFLTD